METALNGLWDAGIMAGDRICVIGAGVVGLLTGWLASRIVGVSVLVIDIDPAKAAAAERSVCLFRSDAEGVGDFEVVVHASGNPEGLRAALAIAAV